MNNPIQCLIKIYINYCHFIFSPSAELSTKTPTTHATLPNLGKQSGEEEKKPNLGLILGLGLGLGLGLLVLVVSAFVVVFIFGKKDLSSRNLTNSQNFAVGENET